jgi:hypothetical protein
MKRHIATKVHTSLDHHAITTVLGTGVVADDLGHHCQKYYKSPRHGGTRRSRTPTRVYDYKDDEKEIGALCFTRRVCTTPVPKGFKLPHDQQKYDGS